MAKWMTIKSKRKACIGRGKQAKCKVLTVKRKVRVNPEDSRKEDIKSMINQMCRTLYTKHEYLDTLDEKSIKKIQDCLSDAYKHFYR